jgi:hypothetical protein
VLLTMATPAGWLMGTPTPDPAGRNAVEYDRALPKEDGQGDAPLAARVRKLDPRGNRRHSAKLQCRGSRP